MDISIKISAKMKEIRDLNFTKERIIGEKSERMGLISEEIGGIAAVAAMAGSAIVAAEAVPMLRAALNDFYQTLDFMNPLPDSFTTAVIELMDDKDNMAGFTKVGPDTFIPTSLFELRQKKRRRAARGSVRLRQSDMKMSRRFRVIYDGY